MSKNLRSRYSVKLIFFLLFASVLAVPTRKSQTRKNKRQLGGTSSSLKDSIEDAVDLDKYTKEKNGVDTPGDRGQSSGSNAESSNGSSTTRNLTIAGGTIAGLVFLILIGFFIYRWRASKQNNQGPWSDEKHPPNHTYERQQDTPPPNISFGDKNINSAHPNRQRNETITVMPKPPPLVLVLQGSKKATEDSQTFFFENGSDRSSSLTLTTLYEMRSPSQDSSISQTVPYPYRNPTSRKLYRSFQPPPIPESPEPVGSRFSWTNTSVRTSIDSSPRFRTVTSWVDHQAGRLSVRAKLAEMQLGEEPSTPVELGHHPGAPVRFFAQHQRLESADLDQRIIHAK